MPIVTHTKDGGFKAHGVPHSELVKVENYPQSLGSGWYSIPTRWAALALFPYADDGVKDDLFLEHLEVQQSRALELPGVRQLQHPPEEELYPYQRAGVRYAQERKHTLFGDMPGLGKTSQAIVSANEKGAEKVLVVCPASVRLQWAEQVKRWVWPRNAPTPSGLPMINLLLKGSDGVYAGKLPSWTIVSYDLVTRSRAIQEAILRRGFDLTILDEVHYLKSFTANRTQVLFGNPEKNTNDNPIVAGSSTILGLTGTPLPNRPRECYAITRTFAWHAIDHMGEKGFLSKYNPKMPTGGKATKYSVARPWELQARLRANFMIRRNKRDVLPQLPAVSWEIMRLEPNKEVKAVLRAEAQTGIDPLDFDTSDFKAQGAIATVRREMGEAKVPLVVDHVGMMLDGGVHKVVIFTWHRDVLATLADKLASFGVTTLKGGMTANAAHAAKEKFVQDPNTRVFIGQIQACGVGINGLQEVCQTAVFAEASWTPGDNEQAVDRLARIGQEGAVTAQFLVAPGGMDDKVLSSSIGKAHDTHNVLDTKVA